MNTEQGDVFAVNEKALDLYNWEPGRSVRDALQDDASALLREVATCRTAQFEAVDQGIAAQQTLLLRIIEALDGFQRIQNSIEKKADKVTPQMKIWINNYSTIAKVLSNALKAHGVEKIANYEQGFDPQWHKVAELVEDSQTLAGTIVNEVQAGYVWKSRVLRKAELRVVGPSASGQPQTSGAEAPGSMAPEMNP